MIPAVPASLPSEPSPFYVTGGTLPADASSYVVRQADADLLSGLLSGEFCYVLNTRQMGKSSLMIRTAGRLREEGIAIAVLDLTAVGQNLSPEQWYNGLLVSLGEQLHLEDELDDFWSEHSNLGPLQRFFAAVGQVVLPALDEKRLVVFVDEIDAVRSLPFSADEFFAGVRECYNRRTQDMAWERLVFCLLGVATPADLITDTRMSPFNVGRRIIITDFTPSEAAPLARGLGGNGDKLLARALFWTSGHPYMTQRLCRVIAEEPGGVTTARQVDALCERLFLTKQARDTDDNLAFVRNRLLRSEVDLAALLDLYTNVQAGKKVKDDETNPLVPVLRLSGVVTVANGFLRVRNRVYDRVFDKEWVLAHMPDAELRRQKAAYRAGLLRATAISGAVAAVLVVLSLIAVSNARQADENRQRADKNAWRADTLRRQADASASEAQASAGQARREAQRANTNEVRARTAAQRALAREREARTARTEAEASNVRATNLAQARQAALTDRGRALQQAVAASERAKTASLLARNEAARARRLVYFAQMAVAQREWEANRAGRVRDILNTPGVKNSPDQSFEWGYWNRALHGERLVMRESAQVVHAVPSPDGRLLLTTYRDNYPPALWDARTGRRLRTVTGLRGEVFGAAFSPDGKQYALGGNVDQSIQIWETATGRRIKELQGAPGWSFILAFSPDGTHIAAGVGKTAYEWNVRTGALAAKMEGHQENVIALAFAPDGQTLATGSDDDTVRLWDAATGRLLRTIAAHESDVQAVAFAPDGKRLASASLDGTVKVWTDLDGPRPVTSLVLRRTSEPVASETGVFTSARVAGRNERVRGHLGPVLIVAFSPDGTRLLTGGGSDNTVRLWDAATGQELRVFGGHTNVVWSASFVPPDGGRIVSGSSDGTVRIWDADAGPGYARRLPTPPGAKGANALAFFPNGKWLVTGHDDGTARVWDTGSLRERLTLSGHAGPVLALAISRDGTRIATGDDKTARLWDARTGRLLHTLPTSNDLPVRSLAFSGDGRRLAASIWDIGQQVNGRHLIWNTGTGSKTLLAGGSGGKIITTPDGHRFLSPGNSPAGGYITFWDSATAKPDPLITEPILDRFTTAPIFVSSALAVSPDGRRVAVSDAGGFAHVLDAATGKETAPPLRGHEGPIRSLAFSPDGRRLATAGDDGTVRLWDPQTGDEALTLTDHASTVRSLAFSPDGRHLAAGGANGLVTIWEAAPPVQVAAWERENQHWDRENQHREVRREAAQRARAQQVARAAEAPTFLAEVREHRLPGRTRAHTPPNLFRDTGWQFYILPEQSGVAWAWLRRQKDGSFRVDVRRISNVPWGVHLLHPGLNLVRGRKYVLQFRARADRDFTIDYHAQRSVPDYESVSGSARASLTDRWRAFRFPFIVGGNVAPNQCSVVLLLGGQIGTVWVADLLLVPDPEDTAATYTERIRREPNNIDLRLGRADIYTYLGDWKRAAADYQQVVKLRGSALDYSAYAIALLAAGDKAAYRSLCAEMLRRFENTESATDAQIVASACAVLPNAVPDWSPVLRLAERSVATGPADYRHWSLKTLGEVLYRMGRYEECIQRMSESDAAGDSYLEGWVFRAMAHHRLGHKAEAQRWLARAAEDIRKYPATALWEVQRQTYFREAQTLLNTGNPGSRGKQP